jgi:hypothetical protein
VDPEVGFGIAVVLVEDAAVKVAVLAPKFWTEVCPQPVVAKVINAAQVARAWNLKRDFVTPDFRA